MRTLTSDFGFSNRTMRVIDKGVLRGKSTVGRPGEAAPVYTYKSSKKRGGHMSVHIAGGAAMYGFMSHSGGISVKGIPGMAGVSTMTALKRTDLRSSGYLITPNALACV